MGVLDRAGSEAYVMIMLRRLAIAWLDQCLRKRGLRRRISQLSTVCNFATVSKCSAANTNGKKKKEKERHKHGNTLSCRLWRCLISRIDVSGSH